MKNKIRILHLYPKDMNIYGDNGNVLVIQKRLKWRGIETEILKYNPGDKFPDDVDIIIGGGGQDSGQLKVQDNLLKIGPTLHELANKNVPMLMICGLYQLFGHYFKTLEGVEIKGIGLLDITTVGNNERLIGNIVCKSKKFGEIVGYENHSGQTFLGKNVTPLSTVVQGAGNNMSDKYEGAIYNNVIGTYLHGSLLPKNPHIADFLISKALENKGLDISLKSIDDSLSDKARKVALKLTR
jgi:CobQ-like glutamine amidotransferase family enzyme